MPNFYDNLQHLETLLQAGFDVVDIGEGYITVNDVLIDTNTQLEMLTPAFFSTSRKDNGVIDRFMTLFQNVGILPPDIDSTTIPIIRDIPLRSRTVAPNSEEQQRAFAAFLEQEIIDNQWTHLFPVDFELFKKALFGFYWSPEMDESEKVKITHDEAGIPA